MSAARYISLLAAVICAAMVVVTIIANDLYWAGLFGAFTLYNVFISRIVAPPRR